MSEIQLNPCPYCGGPAMKITKPLGSVSLPAIKCADEGCPNDAVVTGGTYQQAADAWNIRPLEETLRAEVEQLRKECATLRMIIRAM